jgi:acetylornithine aminotransferase
MSGNFSMTTAAENLFNDPRVRDAVRLLLSTVAEHQQRLDGPRPADPARREAYDKIIARFNRARGGSLYFPYLGSGLGRGALVELADGSVKYDMIDGIGVHHLGHSHPALIESGILAALHDTVMQGNLQQNVESARLADLLIDAARKGGGRIAHCFLTTSGAMANENALKLVLQKKSPADRILAFERCFIGRSLALSQITDNASYRQGLPSMLAVDYVPFFDARRPAESTAAAVAMLESHLKSHPGKHAVMCLELIQGEGGYYAGSREFFLSIIKILEAHRVAVLIDEVQTFGRTTELFAFQHFGLDAHVDLVTIGKLSQVCATLFSDEYLPKPGLISQTFTGSTSAILAAPVIIETLRGDCLGAEGRNARVHRRFVERFEAIAARQPGRLAGPFGLGGMIAFTPLSGSGDDAKAVVHAMFDEGVIAFVAGHGPARVRLLPPVPVVTDRQIDDVCDRIERALERVAGKP